MSARSVSSRRGFSLVEAIVVIVVVSLLVPPSVSMLREAQTMRVDSANASRASVLARAVMEQVLADASSPAPALGMAALASAPDYLDAPGTGLRARMGTVTAAYDTLGLTWDVSIGGLVSASGAADADSSRNIYRVVEVTVSWNSARGGARTYTLSSIVTDLTP